MAAPPDKSPGPSNDDSPHRRRVRYQGKHPRQFEQKYKELNAEQYPGFHEHVRSRGATPAGTHVPIMVPEVLATLAPKLGDIVADCTLGHGGHAIELLKRVGPLGRLIGFDVDTGQIKRTRHRITVALPNARISLHRGNFAGIGNVLAEEGIDGYDVIFADLGVSSMQIDDPKRGFSYKQDGPLDMRMDSRLKRTAADLLAKFSIQELSAALATLADEPDHERIARAVVEHRERRAVIRTTQLVNLIFKAKDLSSRRWREQVDPKTGDDGSGSSRRLLHPAARTFQALRILVNDELNSLKQLLRSAPYCLRPGGRIGILAFHSGEDDLVRDAFASGLASGMYMEAPPEPTRPGPTEKRDNPRSKPARLRYATRA